MLLDIIVAQLEQRSYHSEDCSEDSKMVENIELLKILSEMIQVNMEDKKQGDMQAEAQHEMESTIPSLSVGSK